MIENTAKPYIIDGAKETLKANPKPAPSNAKRRGISPLALIVLIIAGIIIAAGSILITPATAEAKRIADFDAEIAAQEQVVAEKQAIEDEAKTVLSEATTWYYKNFSVDTINEILAGRKSIADTLDQLSYMDTLYASYAQKARSAELAKAEAAQAKEALEQLRAERASRARTLESAAGIQFAQGGMQGWSGLRYWNGTIGSSGCGLCAYTVIIDILCGRDYTPADMLSIRGDWRGMDGYPEDHTGSKYGSHHDFTLSEFEIETWNIGNSVEELKDALRERETAAMVCSHGHVFKNKSGSWRWSSGHFVAVLGYDEQGFHVSDSAYSKDQGADVIYSDTEMARMLSGANKVTIYSN